MDAPPTHHPTDSTLAAYGLGRLAGGAADGVAAHLAGCPDCRRRAAGVSAASFAGPAPAPGSTPGPHTDLTSSPDGGPGRAPPPAGVPPELAALDGYEVVRELGRGGMGVVYLATNTLLRRPEVLKVITRALLDRPGAADRFLREMQAAARLHHPNVVTAYSAVRAGGLLAFAMEYVPGDNLADLVRARGPLPVAAACRYAGQVAKGLQHAHDRGTVHRDIKPGNLILARGPEGGVKILDFGLAKGVSEQTPDKDLTGEGRMLGTPDYMAPEQARDAARADIRADVYSLGCTVHFLLTGGPPFAGANPMEVLMAHHATAPTPVNLIRPDVPADLAAVVAKMMAKDPAGRYQTPGEAAKALLPFARPGSGPAKVPVARPVAPPVRLEVAPAAPVARPVRRAGRPPGERPGYRPWWPAMVVAAVAGLLAWGWAGGAFHRRPAAGPAAAGPDLRPRPAANPAPTAWEATGELLRNPGCEEPPVGGRIPGWEEVRGNWARRAADPAPHEGGAYFWAGDSKGAAELRQDVDVSRLAGPIDAGRVRVTFSAAVRTSRAAPGWADAARVVVEYLPAGKGDPLDAYDSGETRAAGRWARLVDLRPAPAGTRWVRVRLVGRRARAGESTDGYFDGLSLKAAPAGG